jgi:hypothetical protein
MYHSARSRRRAPTTTIATIAVTVCLMIAGVSSLSARGDGTPKNKALVGSWLETVTFPPESGRPPLKSLGTFHDDGTMVCSDQGAVTVEPPTIFTSCHGVWTHLEERKFAYTAFELISDLSGNLVGYLKVRGTYIVAQSGNEYNGTSFAEVLDPDGVVLFSVSVANAGKRIQVELP